MDRNNSTFIWKICNFEGCPCYIGEALYSPVFLADSPYQTHWRLKLYPSGNDDERFMSCYLECHSYNEKKEKIIDFSISILDTDQKAAVTCGFNNYSFKPSSSVGFPEFVEWKYLSANHLALLPQGTLTLKCSIRLDDCSYSADACLKELSVSFKMLYDKRQFTDLEVYNNEDELFPVHRAVICARAPKCARKLSLQNPKNKIHREVRSKISIEGIQSNTLEALLIYLYSGQMHTTDPDVWNELYNIAEQYELFDMKRDLFPTPTCTNELTRIQTKTKSLVFPIKNFSQTERLHMGKLIDLDLLRLGVEYFLAINSSAKEAINFKIWCFPSQPVCGFLVCTVSAIGSDGGPKYTTRSEIEFTGRRSTHNLPLPIAKETILAMKDSFLSDDTLKMSFKFTVYDGREPRRIRRGETGRALSLGFSPPNPVTLLRLSEDFKFLADPKAMRRTYPHTNMDEHFHLKKAIFSAWSPIYANSLQETERNPPKRACIAYMNPGTGGLLYQFMCTGKIEITSLKAAFELYRQARGLEIHCLEELASKSFTNHLTKENAIDALASTYFEKELALCSLVQDYICQYSEDIFISTKWQNLCDNFPIITKNILKLVVNSVPVNNT